MWGNLAANSLRANSHSEHNDNQIACRENANWGICMGQKPRETTAGHLWNNAKRSFTSTEGSRWGLILASPWMPPWNTFWSRRLDVFVMGPNLSLSWERGTNPDKAGIQVWLNSELPAKFILLPSPATPRSGAKQWPPKMWKEMSFSFYLPPEVPKTDIEFMFLASLALITGVVLCGKK